MLEQEKARLADKLTEFARAAKIYSVRAKPNVHQKMTKCTHNGTSKFGRCKGDVVTHVHREEFVGTAFDLKSLIKTH